MSNTNHDLSSRRLWSASWEGVRLARCRYEPLGNFPVTWPTRLPTPPAPPPASQAHFADLEALHAAELAAAEEVIKQTERKFTAAEALSATLTVENAGLKQALAVQQEHSRLWRETAGKWEDAANQSFLEGIWRNLPGYVGAVGAGVILGLSMGG